MDLRRARTRVLRETRERPESSRLSADVRVVPAPRVRGGRGHKKRAACMMHAALLSNNPATTYFRAFGTIIGVGGLTTVFEMGTGVALRL